MRRILLTAVLGLAVVAVTASVAVAANVHFKKPGPTFTKNADFSLTSTGTLTGLGNGDIKVTITGTGTGNATCRNHGGNEAPGQNPVAVTVSGATVIPANKVVNGNVDYTVSSVAPTKPTSAQAGCPNDGWTVEKFSVTYSSVTLQVFQDSNGQNGVFDGPGTLVLSQTFTFSPPL
jgi:hypothetical protein